jgi:hypothetical protein
VLNDGTERVCSQNSLAWISERDFNRGAASLTEHRVTARLLSSFSAQTQSASTGWVFALAADIAFEFSDSAKKKAARLGAAF